MPESSTCRCGGAGWDGCNPAADRPTRRDRVRRLARMASTLQADALGATARARPPVSAHLVELAQAPMLFVLYRTANGIGAQQRGVIR